MRILIPPVLVETYGRALARIGRKKDDVADEMVVSVVLLSSPRAARRGQERFCLQRVETLCAVVLDGEPGAYGRLYERLCSAGAFGK